MRSFLFPLMLVLFAMPCAPARSGDATQAIPQCLDARLDAAGLDIDALVGLSVAILPVGDKWSWSAARGLADRETGQALTAGHAFRIASNTKTWTAAGVLRLVEQGKLGLDDSIARHLPDDYVDRLARGGYDPRAIRVRHLLNHTAGLREHVSEDWLKRHGANPDRVWTAREQLDLAMAAGAPLAEPGAEFHYSDTGYILLGAMIERYTGQPLHAALRAMQRWDALGLQRTWFETREPERAPQAQQYWAGQPIRHWHPSFDLYGGGGLVATPTDMAVFLKALLAGELFESPASLAFIQAPGLPDVWNGYGAGLFRPEIDGEKLLGHAGFWNTFAFLSPRDGVIYAGATVEKTALPYPQLIGTLRAAFRACASPD